jgi:hypothetical protein
VNASNQPPILKWLTVGGGRISILPRPNKESLVHLRDTGVTHVATIQTSDDAQPTMKDSVINAGLQWIWLPFDKSDLYLPSSHDKAFLHQYLFEVKNTLKSGASILLHCDGQATRCRLFLYALCLYLKIPATSTYSILHSFGATQANQLSRQDLQQSALLASEAS